MHKMMSVPEDIFSSGQVGSKIWLCETLETHVASLNYKSINIWVLGSWCGIQSFLLLSRGRIDIEQIRSFDKDPSAVAIADQINNLWVWQSWKTKSFEIDVHDLDYKKPPEACNRPNIVINTSVEHMDKKTWWDQIPIGTLCVLQSCNLEHHETHRLHQSPQDLAAAYPMQNLLYEGSMDFNYSLNPRSSFSRFMVMGIK